MKRQSLTVEASTLGGQDLTGKDGEKIFKGSKGTGDGWWRLKGAELMGWFVVSLDDVHCLHTIFILLASTCSRCVIF